MPCFRWRRTGKYSFTYLRSHCLYQMLQIFSVMEINSKFPRKAPVGCSTRVTRATERWCKIESSWTSQCIPLWGCSELCLPCVFQCSTNDKCPKERAYNKGANSAPLPNPCVLFPCHPDLCVYCASEHRRTNGGQSSASHKSTASVFVFFLSEMERCWLHRVNVLSGQARDDLMMKI